MDSNKYDIERIRKYLRGELGPSEMFALERQAQDDPALLDLMEGMESAGNDAIHQANIKDIKKRVSGMADGSPNVRKMPVAWRKWAIAASLVLAAGIGAFFVWQPAPESHMELAQQSEPAPSPVASDVAADPVQEVAVAEPASAAPTQSAVPAPARQAARRAVPQPDAGGVAEDRVASTAQPAVLSALRQADSLNTQSLANGDAGRATAALEERETVVLAARAEAADAQGKRLAMAIRSLPVDTVERPLYRAVSGTVREKDSGRPIAGVQIYGEGSNVAAQTGADGTFSLAMPAQNDSLKVASIGFESQTLDVRNRDSVVVMLEESHTTLEEVVVAGYGQRRNRRNEQMQHASASPAKPISGWTNFEQYIQRETASSQGKGTVTLKFRIGDKGQPTDLQLEHTTNPALVKRAMEILQAGPRWERGNEADGIATVLIKFQ